MSNSDNSTTEYTITHLAIIPDGNRRWARTKGIFGTLKMYDAGAQTAEEVMRAAFENKVKYVSFWGSSVSNLTKRENNEVKALERVYSMFADKLINDTDIHKYKVKVQIVGKWRELLSKKTIKALEKAVEDTKDYSERFLTLLIGYDGVQERSAAVNDIIENNEEPTENANELLKKYSWTHFMPNVDLIIRTGAWQDPHNSAGFLSLLTDDAQYAFPELLWPDFDKDGLEQILVNFSNRERRLGK